MLGMTAAIQVLCRDRDGVLHSGPPHPVTPGEAVLVGREGDLALGVEPADPKVSRRAVEVTRTGSGWRVDVTNRNGVVVHPWGQPPGLAPASSVHVWPRVALRVAGRPELQHWVLLTDDALRVPRPVPVPGTSLTETADQPRPLTWPQEQAVRELFAELLAWPPLVPATPLQLKQVGTRLGLKTETVQRRLEEVRKKAVALGLSRTGSLTDPEYLYVLVRAGYLEPAGDAR
ncbi:hypothetical protein GCM10009827_068340 [Dactylosporangium maewongense]|uniref:FHA domain-containing protein n=2 Tax=Dactylosporangium maewongense TaxID=634393 RepID=A0ABN2BEJ2_9ACTN